MVASIPLHSALLLFVDQREFFGKYPELANTVSSNLNNVAVLFVSSGFTEEHMDALFNKKRRPGLYDYFEKQPELLGVFGNKAIIMSPDRDEAKDAFTCMKDFFRRAVCIERDDTKPFTLSEVSEALASFFSENRSLSKVGNKPGGVRFTLR